MTVETTPNLGLNKFTRGHPVLDTDIGANMDLLDDKVSYNQNTKNVKSSETIQSVIDSITDAAADNPYTVMVPPGVFTERVTMADYISLCGSGMDATTIKHTLADANNWTLALADNVTLSNIGVYAYKSPAPTKGIYANGKTAAVINCKSESTDSDAMSIQGGSAIDIYNCRSNGGDNGIDIDPTSDVNIFSNIINGVKGGVNIGGGSGPGILNILSSIVSVVNTGGLTVAGIVIGCGGGSVLNAYNTDVSCISSGHATGISISSAASNIGNLYNCHAYAETTNVGVSNARGLDVYLGKGYVYGGEYKQLNGKNPGTDGDSADIYGEGATGEMYLYGVKYDTVARTTGIGFIGGTQRQQGQIISLSAHGTFGPDDGNILKVDPNGAARNYNPSGTFAPWTQITVINSANAAETITVDSAGLNQAIAQNERGIFVFDGTNWVKVFVG